MKAVQYREIGKGPEVVDIEEPHAGPGQVRLKVTAAGLCHSDWFVMDLPEEQYTYGLPLTLGHEGAGVVDELGEGVKGVNIGEAYAIYGPWGCGRCHACAKGAENYCPHAAEMGITPPGLGSPGAMAEYVIVDDPRHLAPLGDLDPVETVSLTDAGLTPYHAIVSAKEKLYPGATAVVIGVGGLGHVGVQILRAISQATVIAVDLGEDKLALAREVGAHHTVTSDEHAAARIRELTGGLGAAAVFDFVGVQPTIDLAREVAGIDSFIHIVGIGGGILPAGFFSTPMGAAVRAPYWGTRSELIEVLDLARSGAVGVHVERYGFDGAVEAYEKLHAGKVRGRAVVVP
ncbi:Zn-dependent alcohol dehydrogenase [Microbacterium testaceum StLB037]|uniref:alcohol dehydrogenase n=1 Tax=Microbacterium testaceum (strain StLB037) TaxID=979556 RepID=E8N955_MICTS|nr:NAD(P)-dependent alcohol dehydrogenase [Microbacterium testaceum]BAJ74491.1 Zn-dependent alcohol dehydrogenase [Microbacterium testaceum StLB037]